MAIGGYLPVLHVLLIQKQTHRQMDTRVPLQAYSEVTDQERSQLVQQEVKGMSHLLALAARPDFYRDMLRDRRLTHPDLLQHCAEGVKLPLTPPPDALSANDRLRRSLSRKLSSGGGSMRLLVKSTSMKVKDADLQNIEEGEQLQNELISVAYPGKA